MGETREVLRAYRVALDPTAATTAPSATPPTRLMTVPYRVDLETGEILDDE